MTDRISIQRDPKNLEERLEHLEEVNRFTLEVLDMAASVGNFQTSINRLHDPSLILSEARIRLERLIPFECTAFFLVDEASSDFHLFDCAPVEQARRIQHEIDYLIDDGSFARALMADKPVFVYCRDGRTQLLLHVLATTSRVRGMFVGIPVQAAKYIKDVSLSLLSIVLLNSANALESFELYKRIREFNSELEDKVGRLTLSEKELMVHRSKLEEAVEERTAQLQATVSRLNDEVAERKRAEELLAGSQKLLQNVFRAIPDLLTVQDKDLRIVMSNCLGDESTPQVESLPKRHCYEVYAGCDSPCDPCPVKEVFASGSMKQVEAANLAGGTVKEIRAFPILNDAGEVVMVVEHIRDITEKRRMEDEFLKAQKLESVGVLAGGIAHDFNNLLTVMLGNISLARMDRESPEKILERLSDTERACLRARDLTMQLLTFSRGGSPIKKTLPVGNILRDASIFALRGSGVKCQFFLPEDLWSAEVDEGQISQVISNLIINACQAMPNGGEIRISARNITIGDNHALSLKKGNYIQISFADSGIGIPEENLSRIFDPYFTTKSKGNGLGLATAYSIIQKHGGLITAESQVGSGATFTFYLPASEVRSLVPENESPTLFSHKRKVLLMDDEALVRDIACKMLTYMGYEVCQAEDGVGAVALYQEALDAGRPFDAVIMDLTVPGGMGGREAIGKLLEIDPNARAIASSGYADDPTMSQFARYGYKGIVAKPYKVQELSEALHSILGDE
jgi:signal transduction histidine kinase/CheY-like chemotaxis protein